MLGPLRLLLARAWSWVKAVHYAGLLVLSAAHLIYFQLYCRLSFDALFVCTLLSLLVLPALFAYFPAVPRYWQHALVLYIAVVVAVHLYNDDVQWAIETVTAAIHNLEFVFCRWKIEALGNQLLFLTSIDTVGVANYLKLNVLRLQPLEIEAAIKFVELVAVETMSAQRMATNLLRGYENSNCRHVQRAMMTYRAEVDSHSPAAPLITDLVAPERNFDIIVYSFGIQLAAVYESLGPLVTKVSVTLDTFTDSPKCGEWIGTSDEARQTVEYLRELVDRLTVSAVKHDHALSILRAVYE
jgi:hypothetical protein